MVAYLAGMIRRMVLVRELVYNETESGDGQREATGRKDWMGVETRPDDDDQGRRGRVQRVRARGNRPLSSLSQIPDPRSHS